MELLKVSPNNNSLIAQDHLETKLVMVVLWIMPSSMLKPMVSFTKINILIKLLNKLVAKIVVLSRFQVSLMLKLAMI
jgi:hypothetical protein